MHPVVVTADVFIDGVVLKAQQWVTTLLIKVRS